MTTQLRFPEFTDEWQVRKLGDIFEYKSTNSLSRAQLGDTGSVSNIHYGDIHKSLPTHLDSKKYTLPKILNDSDGTKGDSVEVGDIVIADASEDYDDIGKGIELVSKGLNEEIRSGLHTFLMSPKEDTAVGYYGVALKSASIRRQFRRIATGISVLGVSKNNVSKIDIAIPSKPEQEKIADFLTAVDERIAVVEKKLELLETYKRGVMQKIFSQQIRFKDENGKPYPDWKEKAVSEFLKERKEYTSKGGDLEHISLTTAGVVPKSERYERDFLVGSTDKQYRITRLDDICYNPANLKFGVIARNKYKDGIFSPIYVTYVVNNSDIGFVEYLVTSRDFIQRARKYEQGTVYERMAVSPQDLAKLKVRMPVIEEQQKIADFLTALDEKITAEKSKLIATRQFKKALLQRMFV